MGKARHLSGKHVPGCNLWRVRSLCQRDVDHPVKKGFEEVLSSGFDDDNFVFYCTWCYSNEHCCFSNVLCKWRYSNDALINGMTIIPSQMEVAPLHCTVDIRQKRRLFKNTKEIEKM